MFCAKIKNEMHTTSPGKGLTIFLPFFWGWLYIYIPKTGNLKSAKISSAFFIDFQ
jgi:hypothetical protein